MTFLNISSAKAQPSLSDASSCDACDFVCGLFYDMGETALKESFHQLRKENIPFKILLFGAALSTYLESPEKLGFTAAEVVLPCNLGLGSSTLPHDGWTYDSELSSIELDQVVAKVQELNPRAILSGSVSKLQSQLLNRLIIPAKGVYYDNVKTLPIDNDRYEIIRACFHAATHLLVPSDPIAKSCSSFYPRDIKVLGHPEIDSFPRRVQAVDALSLRQKLGIPHGNLVVSYIGGYDQGKSSLYRDSFQAFTELIKGLSPTVLQKLSLIIQLHPRQAAFEKDQLPEYLLAREFPEEVQLLISGKKGELCLSTPEAIALSNIHLSFGSSVTTQAVFANKVGLFYFPLHGLESASKDLMLQSGVVPLLSSSKELESYLIRSSQSLEGFDVDPYQKSGIPREASLELFKWLKQHSFKEK